MLAFAEMLIILAVVGLWFATVAFATVLEGAFILACTKYLRASRAFALICVSLSVWYFPWPVGILAWLLFIPLFMPRPQSRRG